jgi:hypothetical protein
MSIVGVLKPLLFLISLLGALNSAAFDGDNLSMTVETELPVSSDSDST